jgi:hypothetical protein
MISATTIVTQATYPAHPTLNHQILLMTRDHYMFCYCFHCCNLSEINGAILCYNQHVTVTNLSTLRPHCSCHATCSQEIYAPAIDSAILPSLRIVIGSVILWWRQLKQRQQRQWRQFTFLQWWWSSFLRLCEAWLKLLPVTILFKCLCLLKRYFNAINWMLLNKTWIF